MIHYTFCKCVKCGHLWEPRVYPVRKCSNCQSTRFDDIEDYDDFLKESIEEYKKEKKIEIAKTKTKRKKKTKISKTNRAISKRYLELAFQIINGLTDDMTARERTVIEYRFSGLTLEEIGLIFGVTKTRIGQIEAKAQRKIRRVMMKINRIISNSDEINKNYEDKITSLRKIIDCQNEELKRISGEKVIKK